jgi:Flp pilus assembly protein CpaB
MVRREMGRHRWRLPARLRYWPVTLCLAVGAGAITVSVLNDARSTVDAFGERRRVPVAVGDLPVGHTITGDDVEWRELPSVSTDGAVDDDPVGRVVVERIFESEPIAAGRLAGAGAAGTGALVGIDQRALAVPIGVARPPLEVGDRVDVLAAPPFGAGRAEVVARAAVVVAQDDEVVTVAVAESEVVRAARAILDGTATLALVGR